MSGGGLLKGKVKSYSNVAPQPRPSAVARQLNKSAFARDLFCKIQKKKRQISSIPRKTWRFWSPKNEKNKKDYSFSTRKSKRTFTKKNLFFQKKKGRKKKIKKKAQTFIEIHRKNF